MGLFRRNDDEIDLAAKQVLEILRRGLEEIKIKEEATHEEPKTLSENKPLLESRKIAEFLNPVGKELEHLEKTLTKVRPKIDSISRLIPRLNEIRTLLEKDVHRRHAKIVETTALIQNLEKQKKTLLEDMDRKNRRIEELQKQVNQEQERMTHIDLEIPKLQEEKKTNEDIVAREEEDINKVNGNIDRILNLQNIGSINPN